MDMEWDIRNEDHGRLYFEDNLPGGISLVVEGDDIKLDLIMSDSHLEKIAGMLIELGYSKAKGKI
jgi:hypothetical protein